MSDLIVAVACLFVVIAVARVIARPFIDSPTLIAITDGDLYDEEEGDV